MDKRISKTRDAIIDAYLELIFEKKEQKITISELAQRANIARKTFYLHYESLEDIMRDAAHRTRIRWIFLPRSCGFTRNIS